MPRRWNPLTGEWDPIPETEQEREERLDQEADERHRQEVESAEEERLRRAVNPRGYL